MTIKVQCRWCNKEKELEVPAEGYMKWEVGNVHIQDALPQLSPSDRELLISGTCPECWDRMFPEEE